jgi:hypothetical protein
VTEDEARVQRVKQATVQFYREESDNSDHGLVAGILVSKADVAAIERVAQAGLREAVRAYLDVQAEPAYSWVAESQAARHEGRPNREIERMDRVARARAALEEALAPVGPPENASPSRVNVSFGGVD